MISVLCTCDPASGAVIEVLHLQGRYSAPNWAPDGASFLINGAGRLWRVPVDRRGLGPVDTGAADACNNDHGFAPDGATIFFCSHHEGQGACIYTCPAGGGAVRALPLPSRSWWHGVSPDGGRIVYAAARGTGRGIDICTARADGTDERLLTAGEGQADGPAFGHDGRRIYWNSDARFGRAQIWMMGADGTDHRPLFTDDRVNWFPHPCPVGRHLVWLSYPPGTEGHPADLPVELWCADPEGRNRRRLAAFTGGQGTLNAPPWKADGSAFAFMRYEP